MYRDWKKQREKQKRTQMRTRHRENNKEKKRDREKEEKYTTEQEMICATQITVRTFFPKLYGL